MPYRTRLVSFFLYDGTDPVCEINASGTVTANNTFGANGLIQRTSGGVKRYYAFDPQGNVANVITSPTTATAVGFDAYGNRCGDAATDPWGYGAQWGYYTDWDAADKLILCTYRYYDPQTGRWLTRDPIGYDGGVNLYGYVEGDPVNDRDSSGLTAYRITVRPFLFKYDHAFILLEKACCESRTWGFNPVGILGIFGGGSEIKDEPHEPGKYDRIDILTSDPKVERALCDCIKESRKKVPLYIFPFYLCGSWVDDMLVCAIQKAHPERYSRRRHAPLSPTRPGDFKNQR